MRKAECRFVISPGVWLGLTFFGLLTGGAGWTNDQWPPETRSPPSLQVASSAPKPLNLFLTQPELRLFIRNYEIRTGEDLTAPIDEEEVLVTAPGYVAPMRDVSQDVWGGIAAPFWAIMNPRNAWRIFVPIPAKDRQRDAEPPAPDPR